MTRYAFSTTDLTQLQRQLSAWRQKQSGRTRLPEAVWSAAVDLARTQGPSLVARALRLDYYKQRQRLAGSALLPTAPTTFVEVKAEAMSGAGPGEWSAELFDGTEARLILRVRGELATLVALAQSFWRRRR
jgi:hypothetical protein